MDWLTFVLFLIIYGQFLLSGVQTDVRVDIAFIINKRKDGLGRHIGGAFFNAVDYVNNVTLFNHPVKFGYHFRDTDGTDIDSSRTMIDLYCNSSVDVFVGPDAYCPNSALAATSYNIPYIAYNCEETLTRDEMRKYKFVSTEPSFVKSAKFITSVLLHFKWTSYTIVSGTFLKFAETVKLLTELTSSLNIRLNDISHNKIVDYNHPRIEASEYRKIIKETYLKTRVYVYLGHYEALIEFVRTLNDLDINHAGEYVVIAVDDREISDHAKYFDKFSELRDGVNQRHLEAFRNVLLLVPENKNPHWEAFKTETQLRNQQPPINAPKCNHAFCKTDAIIRGRKAAYLYDAVTVYARTVRAVYDEGGDIRNASLIISKIRGTTYHSIQGFEVFISELGDNDGNYTLKSIRVNDDSLIAEMLPVGSFIKMNSTNITYSAINDVGWIAGVPRSEPECGFDGEFCVEAKFNWQMATVGSAVAAVIVVIMLLLIRHYLYEQKLARLLWKIDLSELDFVDKKENEYGHRLSYLRGRV